MKRIFTHPKQFLCFALLSATCSLSTQAQTSSTPTTCSYTLSSCPAGISANFNDGNEDFIGSNGIIYNSNGYFSVANAESNRDNYIVTSGSYMANTSIVQAGIDYSGAGTDDIRSYTINILDANNNAVLASCMVMATAEFITTSVGYVCQTIKNESLVGKNIRFQLIFATDEDANGAIILDNFRTNLPLATSTLPVEFTGFDANTSANGVVLTWNVATEVNVKQYVIEKSTDGRNYMAIGQVKATNNSMYTYTDTKTSTGTVYYRIKNVDNDGKQKYSTVLRYNAAVSGTSLLRSYPSPAQEQVTLEHKKLTTKAIIIISTVDGRAVKTVQPVTGSSFTPINLSGLPKGIYMIRLNDGQGNTETSKLIKQ